MKKGNRLLCIESSIDATINVIKGVIYTFEGRAHHPDGIHVKEAQSHDNKPSAGFYQWRFKQLCSDAELLEYKKNVSMKENLSPELIPKNL